MGSKAGTVVAVAGLLVVGLAFSACAVRLVSPYNEEISKGVSRLHEDILKTAADVWRKADSNDAQADYAGYVKTYDDWMSRVQTLEAISSGINPQVINCATLVQKIRAKWEPIPHVDEYIATAQPADSSTAAAASVDCQTLLFQRLKKRIQDLAELHKLACNPARAGFPHECLGIFGTQQQSVLVVPTAEGSGVSAVLTPLRALIRVQEAKKGATAQ